MATYLNALTAINTATHNFKHAHSLEDSLSRLLPKAVKIKLYLSDSFGITIILVLESDSFPEYSVPFYLKQMCHQFSLAGWLKVGQDKTTSTTFTKGVFLQFEDTDMESGLIRWYQHSLSHILPCPKSHGDQLKDSHCLWKGFHKADKAALCCTGVHFPISFFASQLGRSALWNRQVC